MGLIEINSKLKVITAKFVGDYTHDSYKELWYDGLYQAKTNGLNRVFVDQSKVGNVSLTSRGWFVMIMLPLIKKELGSSIALSILPAEDEEKSSRAHYFIKMTKAITSFNITVGETENHCLNLLAQENH